MQVTHYADDAHVFVYFNGAVLLQFFHNGIDSAVVVDRKTYAHFRSGHHVDAGLVSFKNFKHLAEETCSEEHTAADNLDCRDVVLCCDGLNLSKLHLVVDECARRLGVHSVEQAHGDTCEASGLYASGVKNLRTEVSQFRGFIKVELTHGLCAFNDTGVVVVHAVDVGPNLNFFSAEHRTNQACCIVRTTTLEVVHLTFKVAADEALCDVEVVVCVFGEDGLEVFLDVLHVGFAVLVGLHVVKSGEQLHLHANFLEVVGHHVGRHHFALCEDGLFGCVGKVCARE